MAINTEKTNSLEVNKVFWTRQRLNEEDWMDQEYWEKWVELKVLEVNRENAPKIPSRIKGISILMPLQMLSIWLTTLIGWWICTNLARLKDSREECKRVTHLEDSQPIWDHQVWTWFRIRTITTIIRLRDLHSALASNRISCSRLSKILPWFSKLIRAAIYSKSTH